ncbi:hypothetical protein K8Q98_00400, partial [Candidatus Nomurabacteria bacterium]|nr:hypothetical protein [Candidatus Nomurabacteria bacterium]
MAQLRTKETHEKYMKFIESGFLAEKCGLCDDNSIKEFNYWKIIDNLFPYDSVAKVHHMIIPKRHVVEDELNEEEKNELKEIKMGYINQEYD